MGSFTSEWQDKSMQLNVANWFAIYYWKEKKEEEKMPLSLTLSVGVCLDVKLSKQSQSIEPSGCWAQYYIYANSFAQTILKLFLI